MRETRRCAGRLLGQLRPTQCARETGEERNFRPSIRSSMILRVTDLEDSSITSVARRTRQGCRSLRCCSKPPKRPDEYCENKVVRRKTKKGETRNWGRIEIQMGDDRRSDMISMCIVDLDPDVSVMETDFAQFIYTWPYDWDDSRHILFFPSYFINNRNRLSSRYFFAGKK